MLKAHAIFSNDKKATAKKTYRDLTTAWSTLTTQLQPCSTWAMERVIKQEGYPGTFP